MAWVHHQGSDQVRPREFLFFGGIAVVLALLGYEWLRGKNMGALEERIRVQDSAIAVLTRSTDSLKAKIKMSSARFGKTEIVYRERLDSIHVALTDTLRIHDTTVVREYIRAADSTISACKMALADCSALTAKQDSTIRAFTLRTKFADQARPSLFARGLSMLPALGAGYLIRTVTERK